MRPSRVIRHPESVVVVPIEGNDVVLVRQSRDGALRRTLELPAGSLESRETPEEALSDATSLATFALWSASARRTAA